MKVKILIGFLALVLLLSGCAQNQEIRYVCSDGNVVSVLSECPAQPNPEPIIPLPPESPPVSIAVDNDEAIDSIVNSLQTIDCGLSKRCFPNIECAKMTGKFIENELFSDQTWVVDKTVLGNECQFLVRANNENKKVFGNCKIPIGQEKFYLNNCSGDYFDAIRASDLAANYELNEFLDIGYLPALNCSHTGKKITSSIMNGVAEITFEYPTPLLLEELQFSGDFTGKSFSDIEGYEGTSFNFEIYGVENFVQGGINFITLNDLNVSKTYQTYCTYT